MARRSGAAAVAATEPSCNRLAGGLVAAALALPGVAPTVRAESAPASAEVSLRWMTYQDRQRGLDRTRVRSPALGLVLPLGERWSLQGGVSQDSVSGASPRWHSAISSASVQTERRRAVDATLGHHGDDRGWSTGVAISDENDWRSVGVSGEHRWWSEDRNRSVTAGAAWTSDRIGATGRPEIDERRHTVQLLLGVTQAWTATDLVQATWTFAGSRGYHSDPYKFADQRPRERDRHTLMLRWNHHRPDGPWTLRSSWRFYRDSYGIQAHTVEAEWVQPIGPRFTLTPSVRLYTQRAARFYVDPLPAGDRGDAPPPIRDPDRPDTFLSADARLAGFGAAAIALQAAWQIDDAWSADVRLERYAQRTAWRVGGRGSAGLAPFDARQLQVGLRRRF